MLASSASSAHAAFITTAPVASDRMIRAIMRRFYGLDCTATPLTGERDLNVHIASASGEYVLKIVNVGEDPEATAFHNRALEHITASGGGVPTPAVIRSLEGEAEISVELDGIQHVARLLTYLPGMPLWKSQTTLSQRQELGATLGALTTSLRDFDHPAAAHEILWDLKHIPRLEELTIHIQDDAKRAAVRAIIHGFCSDIVPLAPGFRQQVVHNDFNPHNVLVDPSDHDRVTGVLDFGDMVKTPLVYDIAVACSYQISDMGHPLAFAADFLGAYHRVNPLLPAEVDQLFGLINARNAMTVTITEWRATRYPENSSYILRNNPRATLGIRRLAEVSHDEGRDVFARACGLL